LDELSFSNDAAGIGSLLSAASRYGEARQLLRAIVVQKVFVTLRH
jgi:hypothetical protein